MRKRINGARNIVLSRLIRLGLLILGLGMLLPYVSCTNSGVGGVGQPCTKYGICIDSMDNVSDPAKHIICCPNTSTCITEVECYGTSNNDNSFGNEGQFCKEDGTCNEGLVCCKNSVPAICTKPEACIIEDGDTDDNNGGDEEYDDDNIENDSNGDMDTSDSPVDGDTEEVEIQFPENFVGSVCTEDGICREMPWPVAGSLNSLYSTTDSLIIVGDNGVIIDSDKENISGELLVVDADLLSISGSKDNLWAVGKNSTVLQHSETG